MDSIQQKPSIPSGSRIRDILTDLGIVSISDIQLFSSDTRDVKGLSVYRDQCTGVIFIEDYYVGDSVYNSGAYREGETYPVSYENTLDSQRRFSRYQQFIGGKAIVDFGCGAGGFLKLAKPVARSVLGVELQESFKTSLIRTGVDCVSSIDMIPSNQDTIFLFHVFEHLPDPIAVLCDLRSKLKQNGSGKIVIEVPHARDFLLNTMLLASFRDFTLWSQHLILHTRESLKKMLFHAGYKNIQIEGVQRYGISNHFAWLRYGRPGGHKDILSIIETNALSQAYSDALSRLDANDTIVAIAEL